ncbi:hypothetical protein Unana1_04529 [Umbelopsis nana]
MSTPASLTSLDPSIIKSTNEESSSSDANDIDVILPAEDKIPKIASADPAEQENEGLKLWLARRKAWTQPTKNGKKSDFILPEEYLSVQRKYTIYDALIFQRRKLVKPLPLPTTINIIVSGWKRDGTWPKGMEAPKDSN